MADTTLKIGDAVVERGKSKLGIVVEVAPDGDFGVSFAAKPTIKTIRPSEGCMQTSVAITGTGFLSGCNVLFGERQSHRVNISGDGKKILCRVPSCVFPGQTFSVSVVNPDGQVAIKKDVFTGTPSPPIRMEIHKSEALKWYARAGLTKKAATSL